MKYYRIVFSEEGFENGYFNGYFNNYEEATEYAEDIIEMTKLNFYNYAGEDIEYKISEYESEEDYYNNRLKPTTASETGNGTL